MTMLSINTNVGALQAARSSYSVNKSMEQSMERLASGKRINSAADDAAGLAISTRLNAEINGIHQSIRNASDAQGMLGVAEGALVEVHSLLLRMRELAVQSASETVSAADRDILQTEVAQLESEIQRIHDDTTWAGFQLLDATQDSGVFNFHVGPDASDSIKHTIPTFLQTGTAIGLASTETVSTQTKARLYITCLLYTSPRPRD